MRKENKLIYILAILMNCLALTSCWNYREINDLSVVQGFSIDIGNKDCKYSMTAEMLVPKLAVGTDIVKSKFVESQGDTVFKAARRLIEVDGKKAYWSHAKVIIISKAVAEKGLISIIDFANRNPEPRPEIEIIVADMSKAKEIFGLYGEGVSVVSYKLLDMLRNQGEILTYKSVSIWEYINNLSSEGISPVAPIVYLSETKGVKIPKMGGLAVFRYDKMIGSLSEEETEFFSLLKPKTEGGLLVINNEVEGRLVNVSLKILNGNTTIKPIYANGNITMRIDMMIDMTIGEIGEDEDFISGTKREELKKNAENHIEKQVNNLIRRVQEEYSSDIFGFGNTLKNNRPDLWKKLKSKWDDEFKNLRFETVIRVNIKRSELTREPIKAGE